jgi:hypothetical protein
VPTVESVANAAAKVALSLGAPNVISLECNMIYLCI